MIYSIENDFLKVEISSLGAEVISMKSKDDECEYIWYGDEKYWTGHSPIMFPICGRLCEGKYTYKGKEYSLPNHGFTRKTEMKASKTSDREITFTMLSSPEIKKMYPFDFIFNVTYSLNGKALKMKFEIENEKESEIIFAVGAHPAFNVPLCEGEKFEDYYVDFGQKCDAYKVNFSEACLCTNDDGPYRENGTDKICLEHSLFDDDAIFLYNIPKTVFLRSNKSSKGIKMTYDNMKYLGLWHKPKSDAPYVCIEPWLSIPASDGVVDDLSTKAEMVKLEAGKRYENEIKIEIL